MKPAGSEPTKVLIPSPCADRSPDASWSLRLRPASICLSREAAVVNGTVSRYLELCSLS